MTGASFLMLHLAAPCCQAWIKQGMGKCWGLRVPVDRRLGGRRDTSLCCIHLRRSGRRPRDRRKVKTVGVPGSSRPTCLWHNFLSSGVNPFLLKKRVELGRGRAGSDPAAAKMPEACLMMSTHPQDLLAVPKEKMGCTGVGGPRSDTTGHEQGSRHQSACFFVDHVESPDQTRRAGRDGQEIRLVAAMSFAQT